LAGIASSRQCLKPALQNMWAHARSVAEGSRAHSAAPSTRWETIIEIVSNATHREPWDKGKIVGRKAPFKLKDIWALMEEVQGTAPSRLLPLIQQTLSKFPAQGHSRLS